MCGLMVRDRSALGVNHEQERMTSETKNNSDLFSNKKKIYFYLVRKTYSGCIVVVAPATYHKETAAELRCTTVEKTVAFLHFLDKCPSAVSNIRTIT